MPTCARYWRPTLLNLWPLHIKPSEQASFLTSDEAMHHYTESFIQDIILYHASSHDSLKDLSVSSIGASTLGGIFKSEIRRVCHVYGELT